MITFQKSLAAALLSGAVALMTPVLLHAQTTTTTNGSASGSVSAQPANGSSAAAGANAAGAASESSGQNIAPTTSTGAYGGMGTDQSTTNNDKAKNKATSPMNSPSDTATQPH
jgi:hypothetical protein